MHPTRELILRLAAREQGVQVSEMPEHGISESKAHKMIFKLRCAGQLHAAQAGLRATYFTDAFRAADMQAAWDNSAAERKVADRRRYEANRNAKLGLPPPKQRVLQTPAEKEAIRLAKAERMRAKRLEERGGTSISVRSPHQKPSLSVGVTIHASGRGPAYLPGEPVITPQTKFTYGRSPMSPTHTTTHMEAV